MEIVKRLYNDSLFLEKDKEAMSTLVPELVESEDERIRKDIIALIELLTDGSAVSPGSRTTKEEALEWLEKQKEEEGYEAIPVESTLEYKLGFKAGKESEKQKEQKPVECIDFYDEFYKVYTGPKNILAYVNIFVKKLGYVPIDIHELSACVYYVIKHIEEDTKAKQKEQKPAEWDELQSEFKSINEAFEDGKKEVVAHPEKYGLCDCEPKNELSEEDKEELIFNRLVSLGYPIDANGNIPDYNETFESCKSALVHWLRQNLRKMLMNKRIEPDGIKTETLLKDSYIQAYREGVEDSIRELSLL